VGQVYRTLLGSHDGYASAYVARIAWQMDEQRRLVLEAVRDLSAAELEWQPAPGMNTIGMLLAHIAYAENHMVAVGIEGHPSSDTKRVIGLSEEDEGMPLKPGDPPAPALAGKELAFYEDALARARAHTHAALERLTDDDLTRVIVRGGGRREFDVGWMLYHLLEHEAGHRGQIQVLKHLMRATRG